MIETGDWTTPDLIKYLVSVQPPLQSTEIERLRLAPAFIKDERNGNGSGALKKVPRLKASDLYEPLDVFRRLGLPIIDWWRKDGSHEWNPDNEEGTPKVVCSSCVLTLPP